MSDFLARIKPRRSTVAGEKPSSLELQVAEIALNTADGKIFTKHTDGSIKEISGSGGGGGGGSISAIEDIGNVQARQSVSPGVLSWDVKDDENVTGGWSYDDSAFQLSLNKEAKNGLDIRPSVVTMPTTGTIWVSFDNLTYTEIAYTNRVINAEVVIIDLVVTAPNDGFPGEIFVAFDTPYADGVSFDNDILLFDGSNNKWIPTPLQVNDATDWDILGEEGDGLVDGMSMVWNANELKWTQGFPVLSAAGSGSVGETSTAGYGYMVGPDRFFTVDGVDPLSTGWTALGLTGDDSVFSLTVPFPLIGTEFLEQAIPPAIQFCTNGNIHWDATQAGSSGGRNGDFVADSGNRDFWLAFWSQDTASRGVWEKWDGNVWTIRIEFKIPFNQDNGCPVEVQLSRQGGIRVSYGQNLGSSINLGSQLQGIASDGIALVSGFGDASDSTGAWSWANLAGDGVGRGTKDLLDVTSDQAQSGQVLIFDIDKGAYKPADPPVISVNGETGAVDLGIQDQNDYALAEAPPVPYEYTFTAGGGDGPNNGLMSFVTVSGEVEFKLILLQPDVNGLDPTGVFSNGDQVWMGIDGATPQAYSIVDVGELGPPDGTQLTVSEDLPAQPAEGTPVLVYTSDPDVLASMPLREGDILQWNDADQKFKPVQFSAGGGGGGGAVDSVNGETGAVELDVFDLNDVDYNYTTILGWTWVATDISGASNGLASGAALADSGGQVSVNPISDDGDDAKAALRAWSVANPAPFNTTVAVDGVVTNVTVTSWEDYLDDTGTYKPRLRLGTASGGSPVAAPGAVVALPDFDTWAAANGFGRTGDVAALLAEGDILQWSNLGQKFRPAQLPTGGGASELDSLTDVDVSTTTPTDGQTLSYDAASQQWIPGALASGPVRLAESMTATILPLEAADLDLLALGKAGTFLTVTTSHAAWVRFYSDSDSRTADLRSDKTTAPARGSGVLLELITEGAESYKVTPTVGYFNLDATPTSKIYARVTNLTEATEDVTVDVTALVIEA